ncbi:cytochrome o ubiquinol oxidase subunit IV [Paenibacillus glycanilyticus]|uniref:Cytochrome o ubiquinol oxidase subunit IV n=1 Tax=Paenibacillus glycanilyticus TaxID=126569 RepID=A0ABQ6GKA1_9BACL|nr:cytochrome o ubiquinol oxidase subunit IV [Paenibacillus glycanilyticus]GLX71349.1 cytochrome o ubiquinol oxidase subunit IV [Paenibacillus glycanilyticus]
MGGPNTHGHGHDEHESHGSLKSYVIGFVLSIVLTILPLVVVLNDMMDRTPTLIFIMIMAILQFLVQLFFFMHLREEKKPRFNVMALIFGVVILITIIAGSIWIMTYNSVG